ncbi:hypothetical protein HZS_4805 [Henneguya salminicola]|nr:hypothetical protein HZS_4805 [Henneguya salminicola]
MEAVMSYTFIIILKKYTDVNYCVCQKNYAGKLCQVDMCRFRYGDFVMNICQTINNAERTACNQEHIKRNNISLCAFVCKDNNKFILIDLFIDIIEFLQYTVN